jgi:hypothetical protein
MVERFGVPVAAGLINPSAGERGGLGIPVANHGGEHAVT